MNIRGKLLGKYNIKLKKQFGFVNYYLQVDVYKKGFFGNMDFISLFYVYFNYFN